MLTMPYYGTVEPWTAARSTRRWRQADNLARAARKDGKVLRAANPYFVRGRRARERAGLYASWTAEQRQAARAARLAQQQESGSFDRGAEFGGDDDDVYDD